MNVPYQKAALGGTFDHLHIGHKKLLETAFNQAEYVVIGLTTNAFVQNKYLAEVIQPFATRLAELKDYIHGQGWSNRYQILELHDSFGPSISDPDFDVVVVSQQTKEAAEEINYERIKAGLKPLAIKVADMVLDREDEYLSSTRQRQGLVDASGNVFSQVFDRDIFLSASQRSALAQPMDQLIELSDIVPANHTCIAAVGDVTLRRFIDTKVPFDFGIYDNMNQRQIVSEQMRLDSYGRFWAENPAGGISSNCVTILRRMIESGEGVLEIEGEEDLLVLPMILLLPLGSLVAYGQPHTGIVGVHVTEVAKANWYSFLKSDSEMVK